MNRKRIIAAVIVIIAGISLIAGKTIVSAIFDGDKDATHINPTEIDNSTLIIGTHLIHISALTDEIYDVAEETAEVSGQTDMYYKSELSDGGWYQISEASGIADISTADKKISNKVISELYVRYHTKSDGVTYDLLTGQAVCLFDTVNPYDIVKLRETDSINMQLEMLNDKENKSDSDKNNIEQIEKLFAGGEALKQSDAQNNQALSQLNKQYIKNKGNKEIAEALMSVMQQVDSKRREIIYTQLEEELNTLLEGVQNEDAVNYSLVDAIGTSLEEVAGKETDCQTNALEEGNTALSKAKYDIVTELAGMSDKTTDDSKVVALAENLVDINNIMNGSTIHPDREAALLMESLIPMSDEMIKSSTSEDEMKCFFAENESLESSAVSKLSSDKAKSFVDARKAQLAEISNSITDENLKNSAEVLKTAAIQKLNDMLTNLYSSQDNEMNKLLSEKQSLQTSMKKALDDNDLNKAKTYENQIAQIDEKIDALNTKLNEIIQSASASEQAKAQAKAQLGSGQVSSQIEEIKSNVKSEIQQSDYANIKDELNTVNGFVETSPELAVSALKDIYTELTSKLYLGNTTDGTTGNTTDGATDGVTGSASGSGDKSTINDLIATIEDMVSEAAVYMKEQPNESELTAAIESQAGTSFEKCDEKKQAVIIAALLRVGEETSAENSKNTEAVTLAKDYAGISYNEDNMYIFQKYKNEASEFIPLDKIADCCKYRYIYRDGDKTGIIRNGTEFYEYQVFSDVVKMQQEKTEVMNTYARYQSTIYLPGDYVQNTFAVAVKYLPDTDYGILTTADMEEEISNYIDAFVENASE